MDTTEEAAPLALEPLMARPVAPPTPLPWSQQLWETAATSLPLLLMGLLALATWWLVRNTPQPPPQRAERAPEHVADYEMRGFKLQHYTEAGAARSVLSGDVLRHYPDDKTFEIEGVRLDWTDDEGRRTQASATRAVANEAGTEVELTGAARVHREAPPPVAGESAAEPIEIRGDHLWVHTGQEQVRSDRPITLVQGASEVRADRLRYDHRARQLELQGKVRGTLLARPRS